MAAFAFAAWSNTFASPFQFDDHLYVIDYCRRHGIGAFWPPYGTRYITYLTFAVNYRLGGLDVAGYHLVNLLIHVANGVLVYRLVTLTLETPRMKKASEGLSSFHIGVVAALLFTAHPVQTEAITYISQRFASLAALFYLLSLTLYIRWRLGQGGKAGVFIYIAAIASAVIAQKTKEISFTLPFMVVFYELAFFEGPARSVKRLLPLLPFVSALAIIPLTVFGHDMGLGGAGDAVGDNVRSVQVRDLTTLSRHGYLVTQFRVVVTYLRLLALPVGQNLDYDYPMFRSFLAPQVFASFLFLLGMFSAAVYGFIRSFRTGNAYIRLASLGVIWFFATISIESSIIPIKDIIFEHRLYLPSVGAAFSFAALAFYAVSRLRGRWKVSFTTAAAALVLFIIVPLTAASYRRNSVWKDEVTLHEDTVRKSPGKERAHYNLAWAYQRKGELEKAIVHYEENIRLKPDKDKAHYNLALIYQGRQGRGDAGRAMAHFREAVRLKPDNAVAYYNMAMLYWEKGEARAAVDAYNAAIAIDPAYGNAHYNLAWTYQSLGENRMAAAHYAEAIRLNPRSADAHFNLGRILADEKMPAEAAREFRAALSIDPGFTQARTELDRLLSGR
ncbi:MAG: tetratricopeptide repeat protein [Deltaproteobacteria bacterium]|nr:tetratricopeptide repeat protein [Deltaproteobacteria bacterium]